MKFVKSILICALLAAAVSCGNAADQRKSPSSVSKVESGTRRIILLNNGNSPFWDACRVGLRDGERDFKLAEESFRVVMEVNDGTPQGQIDKLRQFNSQSDIAGVAISALDANNATVAEEMRKLRKKGVHVICVDADVDRNRFRDTRSHYIGTDNLIGGRELGTAARHLLLARNKKSGSYVQFVGRTGSHNAMERMDGFKSAVGSEFREADRMADDTDRTRARENVRNAIRNHRDLVALVGIWSYNAPAIGDVVKQENRRNQFVLVAFDAEPIAVEQMSQGQLDAMVVQNPYQMGYQAVRLLQALIRGQAQNVKAMFPRPGSTDGDLYNTGLKVVVPDNRSPLKAEMFGTNTEFLILGQFKSWLDKYGLKGS